MMTSLKEIGVQEVWVVGSLMVFGSTLVHGLTGYPFAKLYHQWVTGNKQPEKQKVSS
ncbi:hypothetical protein [Pontibacter chitinilyticus]|uniref:hypothetical protein n=1 Tax=Pontibacter chitinilyticus TaxID=2674989 RepID=UPI00321B5C78